jgi:hypothetical protein
MPKTVAVIQSNYIPWKGYFDIINDVEEFIFHDDLQYTKGDWRNRNMIKTPKGAEWLTVPVGTDERRLICDVKINDMSWAAKHWRLIQQHYAKAPHFARYKPFFHEFYNTKWDNLSVMNQHLIRKISTELLGINVRFTDSRDYKPQGAKLDRLLDILKKAGATTYVSGPTAKDYIDPVHFERANINLVWKDYAGYPEYAQFYGAFTHALTILDLLFHTGPDAPKYIWGWRKGDGPPGGAAAISHQSAGPTA